MVCSCLAVKCEGSKIRIYGKFRHCGLEVVVWCAGFGTSGFQVSGVMVWRSFGESWVACTMVDQSQSFNPRLR